MKKITGNKMIKRDPNWDYHQPAIYLITLTLAERRPLLGTLVVPEIDGSPSPEKAIITYSGIGKVVEQTMYELPNHYPELQILQYQMMPDHLHIAMRVTKAMPQSLGIVIRAFKRLTEQRAQALPPLQECSLGLSDDPIAPSSPLLWAPGFNDRRLYSAGQLQRMIAYIKDNPRRLALKRLHRDQLRVRRGITYAGLQFDAIGNMELLEREIRAVHVRSRWTADEKRAYKNGCILAARQGAVLAGPFISPDERAVMQVALEEQLPLICLQDNGFPELYKPSGEFFDACAEGRLLLLAPWPYHTRRLTISREQCQLLNQMAEILAAAGR